MRRHLMVLVLAATIPLVLLSGGLLVRSAMMQRAALERSLGEAAGTLALALDADLGGIVATLEGASLAGGLRASAAEAAGRFPAVAAALAAAQPSWRSLFLTDAFGRRLAHEGAPAETSGTVAAAVREAIVKHRATVSGLVRDAATGETAVALAVPLRRDGAVEAVLGVTVATERWSRLLQAQDVPAAWTGVIIDRGDRILAGTGEPQDHAGRPAADWYRTASGADGFVGGIVEGSSPEGQPAVLAFRPSAIGEWTVAYAAPRESITGPLHGSLWPLLAAAAAAVALAACLAVRLGRPIAVPLRRLAAAARAGEPLPGAAPSTVREVNDLHAALTTLAPAVLPERPLLPAPAGPLSILLVEDHPEDRAALVHVLETDGHRVVAAADGPEALRLAEGLAEAPDVVISALRLPGTMDGVAVAAGVAARFRRLLPTVIVTDGTAPDLPQDAGRDGLRPLRKPVDAMQLRNAVAAVTGRAPP